ncbi:MAG: hypothetical protein K5872_14740 [Rhizobiaceae bacterium]|nr:hypothetical protein [Rhizobiaceae bacterium]MCV0407478.1 hypothetical protein [Rhizobiaceae bacterium]
METKTLTNRQDIRDWAAARAGVPVLRPGGEANEGILELAFGQQSYQEPDNAADPPVTSQTEILEWDEWFRLFEERNLALVVAADQPGRRDEFHQIIRR